MIFNKILRLKRFQGNPIIKPRPGLDWEAKATFNTGAIYLEGKVHLIYRAMSNENVSVFGYATSKDGFHIDERLSEPIYVPREDFEMKKGKGNSGCEDPRITQIGDRLYMLYTAFDSLNPPRVALTSISVKDFLNRSWDKWEKPILISPPGIGDKDSCLLSKKIKNKYVFFHRIYPCIWIDFKDSLDFNKQSWLHGRVLLQPRTNKWDSRKVGIGAPPIETERGWLLLYHATSGANKTRVYRLGALLLDKNDPTKIIARTNEPILEPKMDYETKGQTPNTVFSCGAVIKDNQLLVYYGGGDSVIGVAYISLKKLLNHLN